VAAGANALLPAHQAPDALATLVEQQRLRRAEAAWVADAYGDGTAAARVADAVARLLD
jgi:hypothetical protein